MENSTRNKIGVGCASITQLEIDLVMDVLKSERLSSSSYVHEFEKKFANEHNNLYGVMSNSGTSAIHIALEALKEYYDWDDNDEIIVPALTFISTSNACIHAGLKPVFVDVDPFTYTIDCDKIEEVITAKTKAIIPVHVFGLPCEMDRISEIAKNNNLKIVEDCADSHFASYKGRPVGSFGDMAAFSTYVAHTITTGIGGITITNNIELSEILRSLIAHGRSCTCEVCVAADPDRVCTKRTNQTMDKRFLFERMGYSYRVGEIEGALGVAQLQRAKEIISRRKSNAKIITKGLDKYSDYLQLPKYPEYVDHSFMMYPIVVKSDDITREDLTEFLEKNNIETRPLFPLLNQPIYIKLFGKIESQYPVAERLNKAGFYIGCHHDIKQEDLKYIKTIFNCYFEE